MFSEYLNEEEGLTTLSFENGFISYKVQGDECFIAHTYVKKEYRKTGVLLQMAQSLEKEAREKGCKFLSCVIVGDPKRANAFSRKFELFTKFGFQPAGITNDNLVLVKELHGS